MLDAFEKNILRGYFCNFFFKGKPPKKAISIACDWFDNYSHLICNQEPTEKLFKLFEEYRAALKNHAGVKQCQKNLFSELKGLLTAKNSDRELSASQPEKNLAVLSHDLKLDATDQTILGFIVRYKTNSFLEEFADDLSRAKYPAQMIIALLTGIEKNLVSERLSVNQALVSSGLIQLKTCYGNDITDRFDLPDSITNALQKSSGNLDDVRTHILGNPAQPNLEWVDFSHLDLVREPLVLFLRNAMQKQLTGINVLLWGTPGTGKTEFCKVLAKELGCTLYAVGESDEDGDEPSRKERLDALRLAQNLLRYQSNKMLLFDEMDDLFEHSTFALLFGGKMRAPSKVFTNRLFENNPVPTVWIINNVKALDETILRRMSLVLEIKNPPSQAKKAVWDRIMAKHQLELPIDALTRLEASPAIVDTAVRFAEVTGRGQEDILFACKSIIEAIKGGNEPYPEPADGYCQDLMNADTNLSELSSQLQISEARTVSLCLYGPPGTGKTEYIRQLAKQLGLEILVKRASDLLGSYVGETEQAIASAFREAIEKECFLVFDEADSLLSDRSHAHRTWEVSQVNEMLTWMESHPYPFACTTNLMDRLDQAALRRFTFKVRLMPLRSDQVQLAFKNFFGLSAPAAIRDLTSLTPGDFVVVYKKAEILNKLGRPNELAEMLAAECAVKKSNGCQIGFFL